MRLAFCAMEGISSSELGFSVQRRTARGQPATSISYLIKPQGAGYAMQMAEKLRKFFDRP